MSPCQDTMCPGQTSLVAKTPCLKANTPCLLAKIPLVCSTSTGLQEDLLYFKTSLPNLQQVFQLWRRLTTAPWSCVIALLLTTYTEYHLSSPLTSNLWSTFFPTKDSEAWISESGCESRVRSYKVWEFSDDISQLSLSSIMSKRFTQKQHKFSANHLYFWAHTTCYVDSNLMILVPLESQFYALFKNYSC